MLKKIFNVKVEGVKSNLSLSDRSGTPRSLQNTLGLNLPTDKMSLVLLVAILSPLLVQDTEGPNTFPKPFCCLISDSLT